MELTFTVLLLFLVMLFYVSNRDNKINKWCALAGLVFWLGVIKEAVLFNIIPYIQEHWGWTIAYAHYKGAYSSMTWALYSFAMPTAIVFALYFRGMDLTNPALMSKLKWAVYIPGALLSLFYPPLTFRDYQLSSLPFWITYSLYNFCFIVAYVVFMIQGVRMEQPGRARTQKKLVRIIAMPPVLYWYFTVFPTHTLQLNGMFKLWQGNVLILFVCITFYIVTAFKEGAMGLRLSSESYRWNSDLGIVNKGAEYTSHMLKNQTAKMEWCIENLSRQFESAGADTPEELDILTRSISSLKSYTDKMKKQTEDIRILEEQCSFAELLGSSLPAMIQDMEGSVAMLLPEDLSILCDKTHMSEAFANILSNAAEACRGAPRIEIGGGWDSMGRHYLIRFTDHGTGMDKEETEKVFTPYYTTKNPENNFGLGLSYCKSVAQKHGGSIYAESERGRGTTITIELPARRISGVEKQMKSVAGHD